MFALRHVVAASLLAALVASPAILDACLLTCHDSDAAVAASDEPSCHELDDASEVRVEAPASVCGHDHAPAVSAMVERDRGSDFRYDIGILSCESPAIRQVVFAESLAAAAAAPITPAPGRALAPLRI